MGEHKLVGDTFFKVAGAFLDLAEVKVGGLLIFINRDAAALAHGDLLGTLGGFFCARVLLLPTELTVVICVFAGLLSKFLEESVLERGVPSSQGGFFESNKLQKHTVHLGCCSSLCVKRSKLSTLDGQGSSGYRGHPLIGGVEGPHLGSAHAVNG